MPTYTFRKVTWGASKTVKCTGCGKRLKRSTTFWQTLSPFNKTTDGELKTEKQILAELVVQAQQWEQEPETCRDCA